MCGEHSTASSEQKVLCWLPDLAMSMSCPACSSLSSAANTGRGKVRPCLWADARGRMEEEEENCRDLLVHSWLLLNLRIYLSESKSQCWDVAHWSSFTGGDLKDIVS